jgi:hypothetical protein
MGHLQHPSLVIGRELTTGAAALGMTLVAGIEEGKEEFVG